MTTSADTAASFDMLAHLTRQRAWSEQTFGPGARTKGVVDHIRKELREIEADPTDLTEWIDVVILALDGAWRAGGSPEQIIGTMVAKQTKNEGRAWPDWRTADPDKAIEHDRSGDAAPTTGSAPDGYALVPVRMTANMINAWSGGRTVSSDEVAYRTTFQDAWKRVLDAAPPANAPIASDEDIFEIIANAIGNPSLAEDMKEGFAMHVDPEDWLKVFRIAASMGGDRT